MKFNYNINVAGISSNGSIECNIEEMIAIDNEVLRLLSKQDEIMHNIAAIKKAVDAMDAEDKKQSEDEQDEVLLGPDPAESGTTTKQEFTPFHKNEKLQTLISTFVKEVANAIKH